MESFTLFGPSVSGCGRSNFKMKVKWALTRKREEELQGEGTQQKKSNGTSKAVFKGKG